MRKTLWGSERERSFLPPSFWEEFWGNVGHGYITLGIEVDNHKTSVHVLAKVRWSPSKSAAWRGDYLDILAIDLPSVAQAVYDQDGNFLREAWPDGPRHDSVVRIFDLKHPNDYSSRRRQWYVLAEEFLAMAQRQTVWLRWVTKNNPDLTLGAEVSLDMARTILCPYQPEELESFGITVPVSLLDGGLSVKTWDGQRYHDTNELWLQTPRAHPKFRYEQQTILVKLKPATKWAEFLFWPKGKHIYYRAEFTGSR